MKSSLKRMYSVATKAAIAAVVMNRRNDPFPFFRSRIFASIPIQEIGCLDYEADNQAEYQEDEVAGGLRGFWGSVEEFKVHGLSKINISQSKERDSNALENVTRRVGKRKMNRDVFVGRWRKISVGR